MRLFNFVIGTTRGLIIRDAGVFDTASLTINEGSSAGGGGILSSSGLTSADNVMASMTMMDDSAGGRWSGRAHGNFNVYQTISPKLDGASLLISGSLSADPDGFHNASDDYAVIDIVTIGQGIFEG